ncbi:hypothetical protein ENTB43_291 [Enterobacter phage Entb_43]|uniref:Uncharacterized protein n=1 Tax=Enterobacter phage PG7 TaxID=1455074 RepID=W6AT18_9CAUD|nr:hypothetical protein CG98_gp042 [Enterobacter phage PG7]URQ04121.1 hypothetical protein vBEclMUFV01_153 [Enterobacter phage vB_EclM-UFV01]USL86013.1 hypothetical protein [Enterobacter phage fGh-Ecl04]UVD32423.1 hypothetical protein ENTB43_291 [Enterobacter phage Entb_43]WFG78475.1 hypothetical protein VIPECLOM01_00043 [Enterobacter phage vB_VIPECLOM01]AHI60945.1 hypothetical protein PG7_042 [Enterobacter phage PG7]
MIYSITDDSYIPVLKFNLKSTFYFLSAGGADKIFFDDGIEITEKNLRAKLKETSIVNIYREDESDWTYKLVTHR